MKFNHNKMNQDLYENGEVVGVYTMPKEVLNFLCNDICNQGHEIDWHYVGGRAVVKTSNKDRINEFNKVFNMFQWLNNQYESWEEKHGD